MDDEWSNLITWLRSKGMKENVLVRSKFVPGAGRALFTTTDVPPNSPLFTIPESAHMNLKTLRPLYKSISGSQAMSATQMVSMHIFLHRPSSEGFNRESENIFGPYISILPREFDGHPLSWRVCPQENDSTTFILGSFPPSVTLALSMMERRFWEDWKTVSKLLNENPEVAHSTRTFSLDKSTSPLVTELDIPQYLWAWLNVNTRCVYSQIFESPSDPDNLTLIPVLDLANHTSSIPAPSISPLPTFYSPSNHTLKEGEEVYLRYGFHSNVTLFTEYGFVEDHPQSGGQADVQDMIEMLFEKKGLLGEWMKGVLTERNYWGDWQLYENPTPAHPSYRLLPALRLLHLSVPSSPDFVGAFDGGMTLAPWDATLTGMADIVSEDNEALARKTLQEVCKMSALHAEEQLRALESWVQENQLTGWRVYAFKTISSLWAEQKRVCLAVHESIVQGEVLY